MEGHGHSIKEAMDVVDLVDALAVQLAEKAADGSISPSEAVSMLVSLMGSVGVAIEGAAKIGIEIESLCEEDAAALGAASARALFKLLAALKPLVA